MSPTRHYISGTGQASRESGNRPDGAAGAGTDPPGVDSVPHLSSRSVQSTARRWWPILVGLIFATAVLGSLAACGTVSRTAETVRSPSRLVAAPSPSPIPDPTLPPVPRLTRTPRATPTPTVAPRPTPTLTPRLRRPTLTPTPAVYVIQAGDTLRDIAERFDTTIKWLVEANDIEDPNLIRTGATLRIPQRPASVRHAELATVVRVIDGDTIEVVTGVFQRAETVRYIGIDTPETVHPDRPVEAFGREATQANRELVGWTIVWLETDVTDRDRYGRLLRYVYVEVNGRRLLVNAELVRRGLAVSNPFPPDTAHQAVIAKAEAEARKAKRGIWSLVTPTPRPTVTPIVRLPTPTPLPRTPIRTCHSSYPTVCIPPPPPDLDCGEIPYSNFRVVGSDPHRFDGDNDGEGCERR